MVVRFLRARLGEADPAVVGLVLDVLRSLGARIDVEMAEAPVVGKARVS